MRVSVPECNRYYYPDVSVACGGSKFETISGVKSLANAAVIVEVVSESTANLDRGEKLFCYQTLPSLKYYITAAQDEPLIQVYERDEGETWLYRLYRGLDAEIKLSEIRCELRLVDVYARVEFAVAGAQPDN